VRGRSSTDLSFADGEDVKHARDIRRAVSRAWGRGAGRARGVSVPRQPAAHADYRQRHPIDVLATFILVGGFGLTFNSMSLGGLALGTRPASDAPRAWCRI